MQYSERLLLFFVSFPLFFGKAKSHIIWCSFFVFLYESAYLKALNLCCLIFCFPTMGYSIVNLI